LNKGNWEDEAVDLESYAQDETRALQLIMLLNGRTSQASLNDLEERISQVGQDTAALQAASVTISWIPVDSDDGYQLDASPVDDFTSGVKSSATTDGAVGSLIVEDLDENTTYYFRVAAIYGVTPSYAVTEPSTSTLAKVVVGAGFKLMSETSGTLTWNEMTGALKDIAEGYRVDASPAADFSTGILSSTTYDIANATLTVVGLTRNTTYYWRVGSINHNESASWVVLNASATLTEPPTASPLSQVRLSSVTAAWTSPLNPAGTLYEAQVSDDDFASVLASSRTRNLSVLFGASGFGADLDANTTHFFRVRALNRGDSASDWTSLASTSTLSELVSGISVSVMHNTSATVSWTALAPAPPAATSEGYLLWASQNADFSGTIRTSSTTDSDVDALTVEGLDANTTYYFRVGSLNHNGAAHFGAGVSSATLTDQVLGAEFKLLHETSGTLTWNEMTGALQDIAESYRIDASLTPDFTATVFSSKTADITNSTLTVTGLTRNTTYFWRVGAVNHDDVGHFVFLGSTWTRRALPAAGAPALTAIALDSVTAEWTAAGNPGPGNG